jgi:V-type H+-transporting ATPase subunit a
MTRLEDLTVVLSQTQDHRSRVLAATSRNLRTWQIKVKKIKAIYHTMNMFNNDVARKCLIAECWAPVSELDRIQLALRKGSEASGGGTVSSVLNRMITREQPPTHHKLNKLTQGFQNLVDAYGVATYREINPMPFVVITFPFLFAVMFGDAGHGLLVTAFALWMVVKERSLKDKWRTQEVWTIFFGGRYIILLMGLFSIYTGLIYNDIFSKSLNIFGSAWRVKFGEDTLSKSESVILEPTPYNYSGNAAYRQMYSGTPYPIGLDPIWQLAENKITFTNSVKMKFAIIIGIIQMGFGVCLSLWNHLHFNHRHAIFLEFIPQLLFLACIFFYLIILIFYKWTHYDGSTSTDAPSLLIHLIDMILLSYPETPKSSAVFYTGQRGLQTFLIVLAVICIPWMLLGKPVYRIVMNKRRANRGVVLDVDVRDTDTEDMMDDEHLHQQHHQTEVDMSEIWVEQGIHTIEYFLGCISHTASYLRLWALSLAHAQLSEVLWHMVLHIGLSMEGYGGSIASFFVFMPWSSLTVFILLLMEGLSAFLHALRLHWVEFQSKFYKGEGYPFIPFSFRLLLDETPIEG